MPKQKQGKMLTEEDCKKLATYIHHVIYECDDNEIIEYMVAKAIHKAQEEKLK